MTTISAVVQGRQGRISLLGPNAQLQPHGTVANGTLFNIRGIGTSSGIPSDDPAVGPESA